MWNVSHRLTHLKTWFPAGGAEREDCGIYRRWSLARWSTSLRAWSHFLCVDAVWPLTFEHTVSVTIPLPPAVMSPPSWWLISVSHCKPKLNFRSQVAFIGEFYHSNWRKTKTCSFLCREVKERIPQDLLAVTGNIFRHAQPFKCDTMLLSTKHTPEKCTVQLQEKSQKCLLMF